MFQAPAPRWLVLMEGRRRRWGGDLRRAHVFRALAERTHAVVVRGFSTSDVATGLRRAQRRALPSLARPGRPFVATSELLHESGASRVERSAVPIALDLHDDPITQSASLGVELAADVRRTLENRLAANLAAFRRLVVPSTTFADMLEIEESRRIVATNGTNSDHVRPRPLPDRPAIGMVSTASTGRGIELLVDAARIVRETVPDLGLLLWLVTSNPVAERYLAELVASLAGDPWIEIGAAPYVTLADSLGRASVLAIPHPPGIYMDSATPVKLFDSMAAARPLVVTPRTEMRAIVEQVDCGLVAEDSPESVAAACLRLLDDGELFERLRRNGRRAAETTYDWRTIGNRVADALLADPVVVAAR